MNIKDITIPWIIHYYLLESIQNTTQIFPRQIITSGFFRVSTGGRCTRNTCTLNPVCIVLIISDTPGREVPRQLWT